MKRNRKQLEMAVQVAKGQREKAIACYHLGVFHDNNSRESEAIPFYKQALRLGLDREIKAKTLTWLASSLYKTGKAGSALRYAKQAKDFKDNKSLIRFIERLIKRING